jgi:hypothetical protein
VCQRDEGGAREDTDLACADRERGGVNARAPPEVRADRRASGLLLFAFRGERVRGGLHASVKCALHNFSMPRNVEGPLVRERTSVFLPNQTLSNPLIQTPLPPHSNRTLQNTTTTCSPSPSPPPSPPPASRCAVPSPRSLPCPPVCISFGNNRHQRLVGLNCQHLMKNMVGELCWESSNKNSLPLSMCSLSPSQAKAPVSKRSAAVVTVSASKEESASTRRAALVAFTAAAVGAARAAVAITIPSQASGRGWFIFSHTHATLTHSTHLTHTSPVITLYAPCARFARHHITLLRSFVNSLVFDTSIPLFFCTHQPRTRAGPLLSRILCRTKYRGSNALKRRAALAA